MVILSMKSEKRVVYGISSSFLEEIGKIPRDRILELWNREISLFLNSENEYLIILSNEDIRIIRSSVEAYRLVCRLSGRSGVELLVCSTFSP